MSEKAREELARNLAGSKSFVREVPPRKAVRIRQTPAELAAQDAEAAAAVLRLTAELQKTERRLDRLDRSFTHSRYQTGGASLPTGRHARLLSRASRLERQLRALR